MVVNKPASEQELDRQHKLSLRKIDAGVTVAKSLFKNSTLVACVYFVYRAISALSGKQTLASVALQVLGDLKVRDGIYITLTVGGIVYGLGQRSVRRRNIKRLAPAKRELEIRLDPNRSTSGLTATGTTRPEDET